MGTFVSAETLPISEDSSTLSVNAPDLGLDCKSAVLMEASTGQILYAQNPAEAMPPASVTKIMTLLLVMEAMEEGRLAWEDTVTASAHAASMGGSQIFLKEGEQMTARDLIKSVVIASANDAAVALAEHTYGSEDAFVRRMNERAAELGMTATHFENTNGLDDTAVNHVTSAGDIAIMSRELIRHGEILTYSSTWMDSIRGGAFGLTNTNRLVRFYPGCNGLKTGSTSKAGFCISVTAEREGMTLICVIMGAESRDIRNAAATRLLDWGFATFSVYHAEGGDAGEVELKGGKTDTVKPLSQQRPAG
jgi:D-alanyl-D-alanine carboxypeptidase (penicillin-binding protein 5/6)